MPFPTASPWHVLAPLPGRSLPSRFLFLFQELGLDITSLVKSRLPQYLCTHAFHSPWHSGLNLSICLSHSRWRAIRRQALTLTFIFASPVISQNFRTFQQPILWQSSFSKGRGKPVILTLVHTRAPTIELSSTHKNCILPGLIWHPDKINPAFI